MLPRVNKGPLLSLSPFISLAIGIFIELIDGIDDEMVGLPYSVISLSIQSLNILEVSPSKLINSLGLKSQ